MTIKGIIWDADGTLLDSMESGSMLRIIIWRHWESSRNQIWERFCLR